MGQHHGSNDKLARLYREAIRAHAARPVGYRHAIDATHRHEEYNPLCGDRIEIMLRVKDGRVEEAAFDGEACAICLASASLLCSHAPGAPVSDVISMGRELQLALRGEADSARGESRMNPLLQESAPHDGAPEMVAAARESRMNPLLQESAPHDGAPEMVAAARESRMNPLLRGGAGQMEVPEALQPLLGVRPYPSRVRCATLPWEAAAHALADPCST
jgi:nitrogen fixation NifU-like protein